MGVALRTIIRHRNGVMEGIAVPSLSAAATGREWRVLAVWCGVRMSSLLKTYRIYCYDAAMKTVSSDLIEAASDEDAVARAEAAGFGSKCEIWEGSRLVAQLSSAHAEQRA